jgi:hypothetical protein
VQHRPTPEKAHLQLISTIMLADAARMWPQAWRQYGTPTTLRVVISGNRKESHNVNQHDVVNVTRLDVLDTSKDITVAVTYRHLSTGEKIKCFPMSKKSLSRVGVVHMEDHDDTHQELPETVRKRKPTMSGLFRNPLVFKSSELDVIRRERIF